MDLRCLALGDYGNVCPINSFEISIPQIKILTELKDVYFDNFPKLLEEED